MESIFDWSHEPVRTGASTSPNIIHFGNIRSMFKSNHHKNPLSLKPSPATKPKFFFRVRWHLPDVFVISGDPPWNVHGERHQQAHQSCHQITFRFDKSAQVDTKMVFKHPDYPNSSSKSFLQNMALPTLVSMFLANLVISQLTSHDDVLKTSPRKKQKMSFKSLGIHFQQFPNNEMLLEKCKGFLKTNHPHPWSKKNSARWLTDMV